MRFCTLEMKAPGRWDQRGARQLIGTILAAGHPRRRRRALGNPAQGTHRDGAAAPASATQFPRPPTHPIPPPQRTHLMLKFMLVICLTYQVLLAILGLPAGTAYLLGLPAGATGLTIKSILSDERRVPSSWNRGRKGSCLLLQTSDASCLLLLKKARKRAREREREMRPSSALA